jgi:YHS domain-containing protein
MLAKLGGVCASAGFRPNTMKHVLNITLVALLALVAGCATSPHNPAPGSSLDEICHVCRYNNDLACVCVHVKENTPKTGYQGATYYFCSEECRDAFLKKPQKYLPRGNPKSQSATP